MEKITLKVNRDLASKALNVAYEYAENYRASREPNIPMILAKTFLVHHTKTGSIVIKQKQP